MFGLSGGELAGLAIVWLIFAAGVSLLAQNRGHSGASYFGLSVLLSPLVALLILAISPPRDRSLEGRRPCPRCGELIPNAAQVCRFCGLDLAAAPIPVASAPVQPVAPEAPTLAMRDEHAPWRIPAAEGLVIVAIIVAILAGGFLLLQGKATSILSTTAAALPTYTPQPTVPPTPEPQAGSGRITFGTDYNRQTLALIGERISFKRTVAAIAYRAEFLQPAGATEVTFILARRTGASESIVISSVVTLADPAFDLVANQADLALLADNVAGTYAVRFVTGSTVLAEGTFTLVR